MWLGRLDSNQGMAVPKTAALPLGYAPMRRRPGPYISVFEKHNRAEWAEGLKSQTPPPLRHSRACPEMTVVDGMRRTTVPSGAYPSLPVNRSRSSGQARNAECGALAPHGEFVACGIEEMESPAAGKGEDRLDDLAACRFHACQRGFKIFRNRAPATAWRSPPPRRCGSRRQALPRRPNRSGRNR